MNKTKFIILAATFGLAITFTLSCSMLEDSSSDPSSSSGTGISSSGGNNNSSSSGGGGQGAFNENSKIYQCEDVYNEDLEDWIRECQLYTDNEYAYIEDYFADNPLRLGSITNGKVSLQLPQTISSENLDSFLELDDDEIAEYCTAYTPGIEKYIPNFMLLDSDEDYTGSSLEIANEDNNEGIMYMYFSKAGKIKCDRNSEKINIDAKKGWNQIYYKTIKDDEEYYSTREYSTSNILTTEVRWVLN
jgi:hypothetical protein